MIAISRSIAIRAPAARVFDQLSPPENLLEIWPSLVAVERPRIEPDARHDFDWTYRMAGVKLRGRCETVEVERDRLRVDRNTGGIPSTFRWTFEPREDGTVVRLDVEYEVPGLLRMIAGALLRAMNEREAETLLANLKARIETGIPPVQRVA
jgi:carbon monoxide dehydrogenase subunit G